jgi:WD40 repeat protein
VNALITDFGRAKPTRETELIQGAIRLSSHILAKDPAQFASQIVGRLLAHKDQPAIQQFTDSLSRTARLPWLRPLWPALDRAGTALLRTLASHSYGVTGVALSADGRRAVSASDDTTLKLWDAEAGTELRTLAGHSDVVTGVALSADGKRAYRLPGTIHSKCGIWRPMRNRGRWPATPLLLRVWR